MPNAASEMMQQRDLMQTERDEARAGWAEQTADAARLRIALQEAQQQLVQAHEDIDAMRAEAVTRGDALRLLGWVTDAAPKAWAESVREHVALAAASSPLAEIRKAARSCLVGLGWEPARLSLIGL